MKATQEETVNLSIDGTDTDEVRVHNNSVEIGVYIGSDELKAYISSTNLYFILVGEQDG